MRTLMLVLVAMLILQQVKGEIKVSLCEILASSQDQGTNKHDKSRSKESNNSDDILAINVTVPPAL